ncbi:MAG: protein kinase [Planctomycetota bacterium]|jgi:serine/threonine protein kinase|nr:protein kinase [Planctomycetota bacterium]
MTPLPDPDPPALRNIDIAAIRARGRRSYWYEARQTMLDRTVAVKRLRPELASWLRDSFIESGRRAADIVHPSALAVYNVFPEQSCIVMEWCPEPCLRSILGKLSPLAATRVGAGILDGLAALHATGRSHGDLCPGNVFLPAGGGVRFNDFFQAAVGTDGSPIFPEETRYIAPELLAGRPGDWRSDLYSLGVLLDEALSSRAESSAVSTAIRAFRDPDPDRRGTSPGAVLAYFRSAILQEEGQGGSGDSRPKRQYRRIPTELSVHVRPRSATPVETAAILSKIRDIGENGVFVAESDPLAVGSIVELDFELQGDLGNIHAFGVVRWRSEPPLAPGMGVQFVEVDEDGVEKLRNYLRHRTSERRPGAGGPR